jgi:uncharacterized damage-inducible protein DinB
MMRCMGDAAVLVNDIRDARTPLLRLVAGVDADVLQAVLAGATWTPFELLAHLVAVDYFYVSEALATCAQPGRPFSYFDDQRWRSERHSTAAEPLTLLRSRLHRSHAVVVQSLRLLSDEELAIPAIHPRGIEYNVGDIFGRFPTHDRAHTEQLQSMLASGR